MKPLADARNGDVCIRASDIHKRPTVLWKIWNGWRSQSLEISNQEDSSQRMREFMQTSNHILQWVCEHSPGAIESIRQHYYRICFALAHWTTDSTYLYSFYVNNTNIRKKKKKIANVNERRKNEKKRMVLQLKLEYTSLRKLFGIRVMFRH